MAIITPAELCVKKLYERASGLGNGCIMHNSFEFLFQDLEARSKLYLM